MSADRFPRQLEGLMVWIRERPQLYCRTVGETETLLFFLHSIWSKLEGRETELDAACGNAACWPAGKLNDSEHMLPIHPSCEVLTQLIAFYAKVDASLGIRATEEEWNLYGP